MRCAASPPGGARPDAPSSAKPAAKPGLGDVSRLTHLTRADRRSGILRSGIRPSRISEKLAGVYAMPLLPNFYVSHQWLRELRRFHEGPLIAVDFVIPDEEEVLVGHYDRQRHTLTAAAAAAVILRAEDPRGYEILIPRAIARKEIKRTRAVRQVVGWRYWPDAHGHPPCGCPLCLQPGTYGAAKIRRKENEQT
jgi:hypothetical protein